MKYINKITGNPSQIFPSVQYKEYDASIYIGDPNGSTIKEIELEAAKNRMVYHYLLNDVENEYTMSSLESIHHGTGNSFIEGLDGIYTDVTEMTFSPYFRPTLARNAFRWMTNLKHVYDLNLHDCSDLYGAFNNPTLSIVSTVDDRSATAAQIVVRVTQDTAPVNLGYTISATPFTEVTIEVPNTTIGYARGTFDSNAYVQTVTFDITGGSTEVGNRYGMFKNCSALESINGHWEDRYINRLSDMFTGCTNLVNFNGIEGIGEGFVYNANYPGNQYFDLSMCSKLSETSVHNIVANLGTVPTNDPVIDARLKLAATQYGYLSADEIAAATAKGWTIQSV